MTELYRDAIAAVKEAVVEAARRAIPPDAVARAVEHALLAPRPKTRYLVGTDAKIRALMAKVLPDRLADWLLTRIIRLPH
jgi:hypothetical protein